MAIDVFLVFDRAISGVTLPQQSELQDTALKALPGYAVELKNYHFGLQVPQQQSGSSRASSHVQALPVTLTKQTDLLTPALLDLVAKGANVPSVQLLLRRAGAAAGTKVSEPYLTYTFRNVRVTSVTWATSNADDVTEEHLTLVYQSMTVDYRPQDKTGKPGQAVSATYDAMRGAV